MRSFLAAVLVFALAAVLVKAADAFAADYFVTKDVLGTDAGFLSAPISINPGEQSMLRCETYSGVRYRTCFTGETCTATADDSPIDADKSLDICTASRVTQLSLFKTFDAGFTTCRLYKVLPPMQGICAK